jgi:hypothetical protein
MINDTYRTFLPLLHAPHVIALAVIYVLATTNEDLLAAAPDVDVKKWFSGLKVDMGTVMEVAAGIMELYRDLEEYDESKVGELVRRLNAKT